MSTASGGLTSNARPWSGSQNFATSSRTTSSRTSATSHSSRAASISPTEKKGHARWWGIILAVLATCLTIILILNLIVVLSVYNAQANHTETLNAIDRVTHAIKAEENRLGTATATVNRILKEAGQVSGQLLTGQSVDQQKEAQILIELGAVCASLPNCKL